MSRARTVQFSATADGRVHDLPKTWSDERPHELTAYCWCEPTVETAPAAIRHRRPTGAELAAMSDAQFAAFVAEDDPTVRETVPTTEDQP